MRFVAREQLSRLREVEEFLKQLENSDPETRAVLHGLGEKFVADALGGFVWDQVHGEHLYFLTDSRRVSPDVDRSFDRKDFRSISEEVEVEQVTTFAWDSLEPQAKMSIIRDHLIEAACYLRGELHGTMPQWQR